MTVTTKPSKEIVRECMERRTHAPIASHTADTEKSAAEARLERVTAGWDVLRIRFQLEMEAIVLQPRGPM